MTDLKVYYDRQLLEIGAIIEELVRIEMKTIQLISKMLLIMENYICTSFGASKQYYSGINCKLARI